MLRNTRNTTESTPATNNSVGVAVGVSADEVEDIVAKAVSTATTVVRDKFMKHINDVHQRLQWLEAAVESTSSESLSATVSTVQKETADIGKHPLFQFIKTCEAGLVLSVTRILRAIPCVCMYVCDKTPPKPLNRFA